MNLKPLDRLRIADPDTHAWVRGRVMLMTPAPPAERLERLADETIWALSLEAGFGCSLADGLLQLSAFADEACLDTYLRLVHEAAETGPTLARLMAIHLVPVVSLNDALLERFSATVAVMRAKGTYTLSEPLEALSELLQNGERASAAAYLDLLAATFSQAITYNHSVRLVYLLPKAVRAFNPRRRCSQIEALLRVVRTDLKLVDAFLEGMEKGLALLGPVELHLFMDQALQSDQTAEAVSAFLNLSSGDGLRACTQLRVAVPLDEVKESLDRYLNARLGRAVVIRPLSTVPGAMDDAQLIASDGRSIYLAGELEHYPERDRNRRLAKCLVRLEAGFFEYETYAFDLERAVDLFPDIAQWADGRTAGPGDDICEAETFFISFDWRELAEDLFNLFEQARLLHCMARRYPGLVQQARPLLQEEARRLETTAEGGHPLWPLYSRLVLRRPLPAFDHESVNPVVEAARLFESVVDDAGPVEACAYLVCRTYAGFAAGLKAGRPYRRLVPPFGRRLRWDLVRAALLPQTEAASRIKGRLAAQGVKIYRADLQHKLSEQNGRISSHDIQTLILSAGAAPRGSAGVQVDFSTLDPEALMKAAGIDPDNSGDTDGNAFYYPEWDARLHDYLRDYVRVQERVAPDGGDGGFYHNTLAQYRGLVARIRRAFEFLKPEGLVMLRQWPEGDDFDYRALIDFAIDLRAGRIPSDRLYLKRLKQQRDVAALLLVDLSRSTANPVLGGNGTVLTVAKEALVLFCEALQVVGDTYAVAGFSGTGRHAVDYFRIKDFEEMRTPAVERRISALHPQRSTRMGAAIRHAAAHLAAVSSRVRLLIVVSDGFPNDVGYKAEYAIADTRRAVQEARAHSVHVKAITVNIGSDPRLDDLYGRVHHHVIADVRELPDKLLRLYGTLTRRM